MINIVPVLHSSNSKHIVSWFWKIDEVALPMRKVSVNGNVGFNFWQWPILFFSACSSLLSSMQIIEQMQIYCLIIIRTKEIICNLKTAFYIYQHFSFEKESTRILSLKHWKTLVLVPFIHPKLNGSSTTRWINRMDKNKTLIWVRLDK